MSNPVLESRSASVIADVVPHAGTGVVVNYEARTRRVINHGHVSAICTDYGRRSSMPGPEIWRMNAMAARGLIQDTGDRPA